MLTINLEKALLKQNDSNLKLNEELQRLENEQDNANKKVNELLSILEKEETEDESLLKEVFPNKLTSREVKNESANKLDKHKKHTLDIIEKHEKLNALKDRFGKRLFSKEQIENVCVNYGLRFLPTKLFKGNIDPYCITLLKKFEQEHESHIYQQRSYSRYSSYNDNEDKRYMICAPKKSFHLQLKPKDPLFFRYVDRVNNTDYYYLVHKWGKDLSIFRWLYNLPKRHFFNFLCFIILPIFIVINVITAMILNNWDTKLDVGQYTVSFIGTNIISIALLAVFFSSLAGADGLPTFNDEIWDKNFKN